MITRLYAKVRNTFTLVTLHASAFLEVRRTILVPIQDLPTSNVSAVEQP